MIVSEAETEQRTGSSHSPARTAVSGFPPLRFIALDSLRGVASLLIVAYHLAPAEGLLSGDFVRKAYLSVDFFFTLSGFVIAASYGAKLQAGMSFVRYMGLRLGRIYPMYLFMLLAFLAMEFASMLPAMAGLGLQEPFTGTQTPAKFFASLFMVQSFAYVANDWNTASWSVAVEIWLYLSAAVVWRLAGSRGWLVWLVGAILAGCALTWAFDLLAIQVNSSPLRGVFCFGLGIGCWELWRFIRLPSLGFAAASLVELAVIILASLAILALPKTDVQYPLMGFISVILLLVFAREEGAFSRLLNLRGFVWLGTWSYSIYMVHEAVIARSFDVLRYLGIEQWTTRTNGEMAHSIVGGTLASDLVCMGIIAVTIAAAWFTWRFVEEPCRQWSRRKFAA